MRLLLLRAAFGKHYRRKRDHRAVRLRQHFVDHAVARGSGKGRGAMRTQHNQIDLLRQALVEQLLGGIARHNDRLNRNPVAQPGGNQP